MESDRAGQQSAKRSSNPGVVVRATRRGALVLETENARRMMARLRKLRPGTDPDEGAATARS
jgi:hypothetical protein